jgi:hypothetical protein
LAAIAIMATSASAATTRAEFVAQVDPICQNGQAQGAIAAQPMLKAAKRDKRRGSRKAAKKLDRAMRTYFTQSAAIQKAVNTQIATVPPAPDDVSLVQVWLRARGELIDNETQLFTHKFRSKGDLKGFARFFTLIFQMASREFEVADIVRDFGFQYCSQAQDDPLIALGDISPTGI